MFSINRASIKSLSNIQGKRLRKLFSLRYSVQWILCLPLSHSYQNQSCTHEHTHLPSCFHLHPRQNCKNNHSDKNRHVKYNIHNQKHKNKLRYIGITFRPNYLCANNFVSLFNRKLSTNHTILYSKIQNILRSLGTNFLLIIISTRVVSNLIIEEGIFIIEITIQQ